MYFAIFFVADLVYNFECGDGECISRGKKCDGIHNCVNGSDEIGCSNMPEHVNHDHNADGGKGYDVILDGLRWIVLISSKPGTYTARVYFDFLG